MKIKLILCPDCFSEEPRSPVEVISVCGTLHKANTITAHKRRGPQKGSKRANGLIGKATLTYVAPGISIPANDPLIYDPVRP